MRRGTPTPVTRERPYGISGLGQHTWVDLVPFLAMIPAIGLILLLIASAGVDPIAALRVVFEAAFGSASGLGVTAIKFTPLLITGLGVAIGIRAGLWNLGGEGQIYIGALIATIAVLATRGLPAPFAVLSGLAAGFAGGALWILFPAVLRAFRGVNELITTLLMNFVAVNVVTTLVQGPFGDPTASFPRTEHVPRASWLPVILANTQMHFGVIIAVILAAAMYLVINWTPFGMEARALGLGSRAARFTGIPVERRTLQVLLLSGGLAGVAGAVEVLGVNHALAQGFSPGYGFDAIGVALLGGVDPRGMVVAAGFFSVLRAGAPAMQRTLGVPASIVDVTQGLLVIAVVAGYGLRAVLRRRMAAQASE